MQITGTSIWTLGVIFESTLITWPDGGVAMSDDAYARCVYMWDCFVLTRPCVTGFCLSCTALCSAVLWTQTSGCFLCLFCILHILYQKVVSRETGDSLSTEKVQTDQREFYILWGKQIKYTFVFILGGSFNNRLSNTNISQQYKN